MREQSLLEATCGDLFDHIDDLLDFPKEDSAADVLLLDAPAPGSPLSARIIDVGRAGNALAPPAPPAQHDASANAFFAAAGPDVFDPKDVIGAHIGSVSLESPRPLHVLSSAAHCPYRSCNCNAFFFFFFCPQPVRLSSYCAGDSS